MDNFFCLFVSLGLSAKETVQNGSKSNISIISNKTIENGEAIQQKLQSIKKGIALFVKAPIADSQNGELLRAVMSLRSIDFPIKGLSTEKYVKYRREIVVTYIEVISQIDKYYIDDYKPEKPCFLHVLPPEDSMSEIYFGNVEPAKIKDKKLREKYELMVKENDRVCLENSLQADLQHILNWFAIRWSNKKIDSVYTLEVFIRSNYLNNKPDRTEINTLINESELDVDFKKRIFEDLGS
ncbi:hypothetical protein EAN55_07440 [Escherichia albertii]|nr:hypothetical protein [Escherichia albertii]